MDKKLTVLDVDLDLGCNYFFEFFKEETGIDLYKEGLIDYESLNMVKYVKGFVVAGAKADAAIKRIDPPNVDDLKHKVMSLNSEESSDLFLKCVAIRQGKNYEELKNAVAQAATEG
jgi:hypothetical protein